MKKYALGQTLRRIFRSLVRHTAYQHNPLLINSLAEFNFRPPLLLEFPGEQLSKHRRSPGQVSVWQSKQVA